MLLVNNYLVAKGHFLKYRTYVALFVGVRYYAFLGKKLTRSPRGIEILAASSLSMRLLSSFRPALCQYPLSLRQIELHSTGQPVSQSGVGYAVQFCSFSH